MIDSVQGPVVCAQKMKTVVVDTPEERCDLEPQQVCKQVTKLVPQLRPAKECVQVPKEVCATSRVNPSIQIVPYIQKWCFKEDQVPPAPKCSGDSQCEGFSSVCNGNHENCFYCGDCASSDGCCAGDWVHLAGALSNIRSMFRMCV